MELITCYFVTLEHWKNDTLAAITVNYEAKSRKLTVVSIDTFIECQHRPNDTRAEYACPKFIYTMHIKRELQSHQQLTKFRTNQISNYLTTLPSLLTEKQDDTSHCSHRHSQ
jgi:hypothetical protein